MLKKTSGRVLLALLVLALIVVAAVVVTTTGIVSAQQGPGPGMMPGGMPMMMGPHPTVAATEKFVYVVRGDMIYQFRADTLDFVKGVQLPKPKPPAPMANEAPSP